MKFLILLALLLSCGRDQLDEYGQVEVTIPMEELREIGALQSLVNNEPASIQEINCLGIMVGLPGASVGPGLSQNKGFCREKINDTLTLFPVSSMGGLVPISGTVGENVTVTIPNVLLNVPVVFRAIGFKSPSNSCARLDPSFNPEANNYSKAYRLARRAFNSVNTAIVVDLSARFFTNQTIEHCEGPIFDFNDNVPFTVTSAQLEYWIDASDSSTYTATSTVVNSISQNGLSPAQPSIVGAGSEIVETTWGSAAGLNSFQFQGGKSINTGFRQPTNSTIFIVMQTSATAGDILSFTDGTNSRILSQSASSILLDWNEGGGISLSSPPTINANTNYLLSIKHRNGTFLDLHLNSVAPVYSDAAIPSLTSPSACSLGLGGLITYAAGCSGASAGNAFHGKIAEVLIYNNALNATDFQMIQNYLRNKWSVPLN